MSRDKTTLAGIIDGLGWRKTRIKHGWLVYPPNGTRPIAIHQSQRSDRRYIRNAIAQLRRAGADI